MPAKYRNPWHSPCSTDSTTHFTTSVRPTEYRGYQIYERVPHSWDVVKDGCCIRQLAGFKGATACVDAHIAGKNYPPEFSWPDGCEPRRRRSASHASA